MRSKLSGSVSGCARACICRHADEPSFLLLEIGEFIASQVTINAENSELPSVLIHSAGRYEEW